MAISTKAGCSGVVDQPTREPAVVVSGAQARLNARPDVAAVIAEAMDHPERDVPRRPRH